MADRLPGEATLKGLARGALPVGTRRRDVADAARRTLAVAAGAGSSLGEALDPHHARGPVDPARWLSLHHRDHESAAVRDQLMAGFDRAPDPGRLRVVVDARGSTPSDLGLTTESLESQWSGRWVCSVAGDDAALARALRRAAAEDPRSPLAVVRAGDRLRPDLVARVLDAFWEDSSLALVHWDEAVVQPGGVVRGEDLWFRPSWSPDLMLSANALGRCFALRAQHWAEADCALGDAMWWQVLLRASPDQTSVRRLVRVGSHTAGRHDPVTAEGRGVVGAELGRRGWSARPIALEDAVWLDWELPRWPRVSIVVPTRFSTELLVPLFESLERTEYPDVELVVVDNSGRTDAKQRWYDERLAGTRSRVEWWEDEPFNYSAVNNHGARLASGEVLVFLNDDTEALSAGWLRQLVGWAVQPEVGTVGAQLVDPSGLIQHGGVVLGLDASAGHLFAGARPGSTSMLGSTRWVRNVLASTAACVAMRTDVFEACGGFDERLELCGSDVVLGLAAHLRGWRNVVVPGAGVLHRESATRDATSGVPGDLFASWWHYQRWLTGGDPFFSPSLSVRSHRPRLRPPGEMPAAHQMLEAMQRPAGVFRQELLEHTSRGLALAYPAGEEAARNVADAHGAVVGRREVRTLNWVLPPFDNPFYGGLATIARIADQLVRNHDVTQRFVICDREQELFYRSALAAASAELGDCELVFLGGDGLGSLDLLPAADATVATMWTTAHVAAMAPHGGRRFYLVQDHEPTFYPAGTLYALAEETYRLGLVGICNTEPIHTMYTGRYGGTGDWFLPAVDRDLYHPPEVPRWAGRDPDEPVRIFVYARPGHWRNCWEIAEPALKKLKADHGQRVHIVTAGSWATSSDLGGGIEHLGLMDLRSTAELYRRCDIGMALTVSEHPSYLPGELMACGVPVVTFDLPEAGWILDHGTTGLRARQTVGGVHEQLERLVSDADLRRRCSQGALAHIDANQSDWDSALAGVWDLLCDPEVP